MKNRILFILITIFCFLQSDYSQERRISIDKEGKIDFISANLELKLGLFSEYVDFQQACLFQISDTLFALEIYYRPQETVLKERILLSAEEVVAFRNKVLERIRLTKARAIFNQEGRPKLIAGIMALSLGYYGWAVPSSFDVENEKVAVGLYMLTSGAGIYAPLSFTKDIPVSDAAASLSLYGGTRGIIHGMSFANLFTSSVPERRMVAFGMSASVMEIFLGYHVANKYAMSSGTAEAIAVGGDFGLGLGLGAAHLSGFFDDDSDRAAAGLVLLGSGVGLFGGKLFFADRFYTKGDAYVLSSAGILGAYASVALLDVAGPEDEKAYTAVAMAGSVFGLCVGHYATRGKKFTSDQGNLMRFGALGGGLLGFGVAYLLSPEEGDNRALYLTASSFGSVAGFWAVYHSYVKKLIKFDGDLSLNIKMKRAGFGSINMSEKYGLTYEKSIPFLTLNLSF